MLLEHLLSALPRVSDTGESSFTNLRFKAHGVSPACISREAEVLLDMSPACIEMREALELPVVGSVGKLFMESREEASRKDEHRRGPRRHAAALLSELRLRDGNSTGAG